MADLQRTLEIVFEGTDHVGGVVKGISGTVDKFAGSVGDITQPLADFTTNLLKVEGAIIGVGTAYAVYAFNSAKKFEAAQIDLAKVMDDSEGSVEQYSEKVFELSNKYGISASTVLQSAADFRQAGNDTTTSFNLVEIAIKGAISGNVELAESSELVKRGLAGFKAPATEAERYFDVINAASNKFNTSFGELAIGMSDFSPIASKANLTFEETAAVLVPVIEVFGSGSEAANALKTGLLRLISDLPRVTDELGNLKVSQFEANGELRSGEDILRDVQVAFQGLTSNQQLYSAGQLAGIKQAGKMSEVFAGLTRSQEVYAEVSAAAGSVTDETAKRLKSAEIAAERAKVGFENLATSIGKELKAEVVEVINGVSALEIAMQGVVENGGLKPLFEALGPQIENISNLLKAMAKNLPAAFDGLDFSKLVNSFGGLGDEISKSFEAFFGPVDLSTVEGLQKTIQSIVDGIATLTEVSGGVVRGFKPFLEQLGKLKDEFFGMDAGAANAIGNMLGMATAINALIGPLQSALGAVSGVGTAIEIMAGVQVAKLVGSIGGVGGLSAVMAGPGGMVAALTASFAAGKMFGDGLREHFPIIDEWAGKTANLIGIMLGQADLEVELNKIKAAGTNLTKEQIEAYRERNKALFETPTEVTTKLSVEADNDAQGVIDWSKDPEIQKLVNVLVDPNAVDKVKSVIPPKQIVKIIPVLDQAKLDLEQNKVDNAFTIKNLELATEIDVTKIKEQAETIRAAFEVKASVDIAEIEASVRTIESLGDGIEEIFKATGETVSTLFGEFSDIDLGSSSIRKFIEKMYGKENDLREKALLLQEKLVDAQTRFMDAKTDAMNSGDALLSVSAEGLYPELDMILFEIVKRFHIRATAEQAEFLLGMGT